MAANSSISYWRGTWYVSVSVAPAFRERLGRLGTAVEVPEATVNVVVANDQVDRPHGGIIYVPRPSAAASASST